MFSYFMEMCKAQLINKYFYKCSALIKKEKISEKGYISTRTTVYPIHLKK